MAVIDRNGPIANSWVHLADDAQPAKGQSVIVSFARLKNEHNSLFSASTAVGVEVVGDVVLEDLEPFLPRLGIIVVRMPNMRDGRIFSTGRLLREKYAYKGELRAIGDFIPDQARFLLRCGFDSFEVGDAFPVDSLKQAVATYSVWYQRATDRGATIIDQRTSGVS